MGKVLWRLMQPVRVRPFRLCCDQRRCKYQPPTWMVSTQSPCRSCTTSIWPAAACRRHVPRRLLPPAAAAAAAACGCAAAGSRAQ